MSRFLQVAVAVGLMTVGAWAQPQKRGEGASAVCDDARTLAKLARLDELPDAETVAIQANVWCAARETRESLQWPNKKNARHPSGAWSYPNGRPARTSTGVWKYASGGSVRASSGLLAYPNGKSARLASGRWYRPDGQAATESELLLWACQKLGDEACRRPLSEIRSLSGFDRDVAMLALAWAAR